MGGASVMRPVTGSAGPTLEGAMAVRGALAAPEQCSQAVVLVPWLPPGTPRPWQGSPVMRISGGALL